MEAEQVREIAAGLSETQREAIIGATDLMSSHGGYPFFVVDFTQPWTAPVAQFLTLKSDRLTSLGIAVRAHLLENRLKPERP